MDTNDVINDLNIPLAFRHLCAIWVEKDGQVREIGGWDFERCIEVEVKGQRGQPFLDTRREAMHGTLR